MGGDHPRERERYNAFGEKTGKSSYIKQKQTGWGEMINSAFVSRDGMRERKDGRGRKRIEEG